MAVIKFIIDNWASLATILFLVSELMAISPKFKNNGIFQMISNWLKGFAKEKIS